MAELAIEQSFDLRDYLDAFRRRLGTFLTVGTVVLALGLVTAFTWPPTYKASSTILIEEQDIPTDLIQSTVTSYASQRIQVISQTVMTRNNLLEIIERYDLYKRDRKRKTTEEVLSDMRKDINIDMINANVMDPRTGRPTAATIAFTVGYQGETPKLVQAVASELTTLYLNENLRNRTEKATETYDFLTVEANRLKEEIAKHERELSALKEANINTLPELRDLNSQALDRAERELENIDTQVQSLKERKIYLEGQLPLIDPYNSSDMLNPSARLDALQTEYLRLTSRYSADHPDVLSVKREIEALEAETGVVSGDNDKAKKLEDLRTRLAEARQNYTAEHPDIKSLQRRIEKVEQEQQAPAVSRERPAASRVKADNPAYVNLQTQLSAVNSELGSMVSRRAAVLEKIADYENRLLQTPRIEEEYRRISRDLVNATDRYQEIRAKQMQAEIAKELEAERKGEKFTLIDPAILPEEPVSPNRPAIIFLSLVLAIGTGLGSAALRESLDNTVRGSKGIISTINTAPLAVIPYLSNAAEGTYRKRKRLFALILIVAVIATVVALIHYLVIPLDVAWFRILRKLGFMVDA
jgi:uncharacterized protein involved in exopolysaccharide biosynthesis